MNVDDIKQWIVVGSAAVVGKTLGPEAIVFWGLASKISTYASSYAKCIDIAGDSELFKRICDSIRLLVTMNVFWVIYNLSYAYDIGKGMGVSQISRVIKEAGESNYNTIKKYFKNSLQDALLSTSNSQKAMVIASDAEFMYNLCQDIHKIDQKSFEVALGGIYSYLISTASASAGSEIIKQIEESNKAKSQVEQWKDFLLSLPKGQQEVTLNEMKNTFENINKIDLVKASEFSFQILNVTTETLESLSKNENNKTFLEQGGIDLFKPLRKQAQTLKNIINNVKQAPSRVLDNFKNYLYSTDSNVLRRVFGNKQKLDILRIELKFIQEITEKKLDAAWNETAVRAYENVQYAINPTFVIGNEWANQPLIPIGQQVENPFIGEANIQVGITNGTTISIVLLLIWTVIIAVAYRKLPRRRAVVARNLDENRLLQQD